MAYAAKTLVKWVSKFNEQLKDGKISPTLARDLANAIRAAIARQDVDPNDPILHDLESALVLLDEEILRQEAALTGEAVKGKVKKSGTTKSSASAPVPRKISAEKFEKLGKPNTTKTEQKPTKKLKV
ncbi:hypothetical protein WJ24_03795 [Burkholderia vietnamiensis]|uniref:hypothetical protein n=1 Tax=Burkholderia vietnamiensis TaxID=60552 RepID=UPI0007554B67|nr:hypothetical protein [Burkholderia vietnamiensis]KVE11178.1 hypothetical protein WI92_00635 [Burkholderia vietnamiensis]KVG13474.1 hypothetical protein WJ24_03795 [Burkholderia vietnamiensis]MCA8014627.1 hypothetical protein [Burkholderia vietnamiensis]MDN7412659.1 hypothetical protein [Burkholderia vietnamiensis]HDR9022711.1 hypothetical protein [Burkholderia vietnamiensis]